MFLCRLVKGLCLALASVTMPGIAPARADGGAHIVDSVTPETPGLCHLESWVTGLDRHHGLANLSPACTPLALPWLEIGASAQQNWGGVDDLAIGPTVKLNLRPADTGFGIGLIASGDVGVRSGRAESLALIVPVSIPLSDDMTVNVNAGWDYLRMRADHSKLFYGAQVNMQVAPHVTMMIEMFGHNGEQPGEQLGLRFTPAEAGYDIDLLAGHRIDGQSDGAVTLGFTVRN